MDALSAGSSPQRRDVIPPAAIDLSPRPPFLRGKGERIGLTRLGLRDQLLHAEPRIMLDDRGATDMSIFILPFSLQPGDAEIVGQHIRNALDNAPLPQARTFSHERGTTGDSPFKDTKGGQLATARSKAS